MNKKERLEKLIKIIADHKGWARGTHYAEVTHEELIEIERVIEDLQELKKQNHFLESAHQTNLKIAMNEQAENKELKTRIYELESENEKYREKLDRMLIERCAIESKLGQATYELSFYKLKQKEGKR